MSSVSFGQPGEPHLSAEIQSLLEDAQPGTIIDVPFPTIMNVVLTEGRKETLGGHIYWSSKFDLARQEPSVTPIVPLLPKRRTLVHLHIQGYRDPLKFEFQAHICELAWSFSYYKGEGQTLDKVIIDVNNYRSQHVLDLSFEQLFVGLSRIRDPNTGLRLMPINQRRRHYTSQHIASLRPPRLLHSWRSHLTPIPGTQDPQRFRYEAPETLDRYTEEDIRDHDQAFSSRTSRKNTPCKDRKWT
jgi:hypothetical protein